MLSLLYLHHIQILTIHCFAHFSVTTPSQGKALQNPSQIPFEKCEYAGKEESYSEVQNCIGRALQYISLSILLFTRLCLIMCQWNKAVKALKVQESSKSILQAAAHAQAPKTACKTIIISSKPLKYLQVSNCSHHHFLLARFCWQNSCLSVMYQSGLQNW